MGRAEGGFCGIDGWWVIENKAMCLLGVLFD